MKKLLVLALTVLSLSVSAAQYDIYCTIHSIKRSGPMSYEPTETLFAGQVQLHEDSILFLFQKGKVEVLQTEADIAGLATRTDLLNRTLLILGRAFDEDDQVTDELVLFTTKITKAGLANFETDLETANIDIYPQRAVKVDFAREYALSCVLLND